MRNRHFSFLMVLLGLICLPSPSQQTTPLPFTLKPVGDRVYAAIDDAKGDSGANAGFVIGETGVAVIDSFENEAAARALLAEIRKVTPLPIKFIINTHYHLDHVAGNKVFRDAGALIVAQRNVFSWVNSENLKFFGNSPKPDQVRMVEALVRPDILYDRELVLVLGQRKLLIGAETAHTGGDSLVLIPDAHVYFCGDLFWRRTLPNLIDATVADWFKLDALAKKPAHEPAPYVFVPGHGDVGTAQDLTDFVGYLIDLEKWVRAALNEGKTGSALESEVLPKIKEKYGSWEFFDYFSKSNISDMSLEITGKKKIPIRAPLDR